MVLFPFTSSHAVTLKAVGVASPTVTVSVEVSPIRIRSFAVGTTTKSSSVTPVASVVPPPVAAVEVPYCTVPSSVPSAVPFVVAARVVETNSSFWTRYLIIAQLLEGMLEGIPVSNSKVEPVIVVNPVPAFGSRVKVASSALAGRPASPEATKVAAIPTARPLRVMFLAMFLFLSWFTPEVFSEAVKISHHQPSRRW